MLQLPAEGWVLGRGAGSAAAILGERHSPWQVAGFHGVRAGLPLAHGEGNWSLPQSHKMVSDSPWFHPQDCFNSLCHRLEQQPPPQDMSSSRETHQAPGE